MGAVMFAGIPAMSCKTPTTRHLMLKDPLPSLLTTGSSTCVLLPLDVLFAWKFSNARSTQSFMCSGSSKWKCTAILIRRMLLRLCCGLLMCFLESSYYLVQDFRERAASHLHQDA